MFSIAQCPYMHSGYSMKITMTQTHGSCETKCTFHDDRWYKEVEFERLIMPWVDKQKDVTHSDHHLCASTTYWKVDAARVLNYFLISHLSGEDPLMYASRY